MKNVLYTLLLVAAFAAKGQETVQFPQLKKQIDSLALADKKAGQDLGAGKIEERDSLRKSVKETFLRNAGLLKKKFSADGFPN